MSDSILELVDNLPENNITVKVLKALDFVVPGEWENIVGFDNTIKAVTNEQDSEVIAKIRNQAIALYVEEKRYSRAIRVYKTVDNADAALAAAALANKVSEKIGFLSFLNKITPKADTAQAIDLALKIVAELIAYGSLHGMPELNPQGFVAELNENYKGSALMRMGALVAIDGIAPLGPDFLKKVMEILENQGENGLANNGIFQGISGMIPGDDKLGFVINTFDAVGGWMENLVGKVGLTPEKISNSISGFADFSDQALDLVAALLDQMTNYYEHTGIQTVSRKLILDAALRIDN